MLRHNLGRLLLKSHVSKESPLQYFQSLQFSHSLHFSLSKFSSDYSFMFKDRGLSFVLLDQLTQEDLMNKQLVDHRDEMAGQFQKEYREYLQQEGLDESVCIGRGGKYPAEFCNVQISDLETNIKRKNCT